MNIWKVYAYNLEGDKQLDIVAEKPNSDISRDVEELIESNINLDDIKIESGEAKKIGEVKTEDSEITESSM